MRKSLFEKLGLIEAVNVDNLPSRCQDLDWEGEVESEPAPEVNVPETVEDNLIEDLYAKNNMNEKSRSIFKVEEVSKSLPDTMPTDTKRASIIGILASFGLDVECLVEDAANRRAVVVTATKALVEDRESEISRLGAAIEDLRKQIESYEAEIKDHEVRSAFISQTAEEELKHIDSLVNFLTAGVDKRKEDV